MTIGIGPSFAREALPYRRCLVGAGTPAAEPWDE